MKLDRDILEKCYKSAYYDAIIEQYKRKLESQGFAVLVDHQVFGIQAGLYAEKETEKRVYEFRLIGNNTYTKGYLSHFKETVVSNGAVPYMVYVNPHLLEKRIAFDDLGVLLNTYFANEEIPSELNSLSTHTTIEEIEIDDLVSVEITGDEIAVEGHATILANLQYGSDSDMSRDDGLSYNSTFQMHFHVTLEYDDAYSIKRMDDCKVDTSGFYG